MYAVGVVLPKHRSQKEEKENALGVKLLGGGWAERKKKRQKENSARKKNENEINRNKKEKQINRKKRDIKIIAKNASTDAHKKKKITEQKTPPYSRKKKLCHRPITLVRSHSTHETPETHSNDQP